MKVWATNALALGAAFGLFLALIERSPGRGLIGGALFGVLIATYGAWRKWPSVTDRLFSKR